MLDDAWDVPQPLAVGRADDLHLLHVVAELMETLQALLDPERLVGGELGGRGEFRPQ